MYRISDVPLSGSFDVLGVWTFPNCNRHIAGRITKNERDDIMLHIMVPVQTQEDIKTILEQTRDNKLNRVDGILETGENVVLEDLRLHHTTSSQKVIVRLYRVVRMFVGDCSCVTDDRFNKIAIQYTSLYTWLSPNPIKLTPTKHKTIIEHTHPKSINVNIPGGFTLQIDFEYTISGSIIIKDFIIPQSASIMLVSNESLDLNKLINQTRHFRNFLMLATATPVQPKSVKIGKNNKLFTVFGSQRTYSDVVDEQDVLKMFFTYPCIKSEFNAVIIGWFEFYDKYAESLDLYFDTQMDRQQLTVDLTFLRMVLALEAMSRIDCSKMPALKDRLAGMLDGARGVLDKDESKEQFAKRVVDARNYIAHGLIEKSTSCKPSPYELIQWESKLDLLMYQIIIKKMKITDELKKRIIDKKIKTLPRHNTTCW